MDFDVVDVGEGVCRPVVPRKRPGAKHHSVSSAVCTIYDMPWGGGGGVGRSVRTRLRGGLVVYIRYVMLRYFHSQS